MLAYLYSIAPVLGYKPLMCVALRVDINDVELWYSNFDGFHKMSTVWYIEKFAKRILSNKTETLSISTNCYTFSINLVAAYMILNNNSYNNFLCA